MRINNIFPSIQGEGKYTGHPALFIRTSGCTRECAYCDTKYHKDGRKIKLGSIARAIKKSKLDNIVWTGGEPILQQDDIYEVIERTYKYDKKHHLETNGDIFPKFPSCFNYICFSPKEERTAVRLKEYTKSLHGIDWDIKVVTDLNMNKDLIKYATMLMPLTTGKPDKDKQIQQKVWKYCVHNNIKYSQRIHIDVWGNKRGV